MKLDFSSNGYTQILKLLIESKTQFLHCRDLNNLKNSRNIFLRHDVDADVAAASKMSKIESDLGVKSTYFLMIRSCVYNLFTENNFAFAKEILKNGHEIGLHFDLAFCKMHNHKLNDAVSWEKKILEDSFGTKVNCISYHQPDVETIQKQIEFEDISNVYNYKLNYGLDYYSDSNLDQNRIQNFISESQKNEVFNAQLLIHPMWWINNDGASSTHEVWINTLLQNMNNSQEHLLRYERAFGAKKEVSIEEKK